MVRRVQLHGVTAEVTAPRALNATLSIVYGAYPSAPADVEPDLRIAIEPGESERQFWTVTEGERRFPESARRGMAAIRAEWVFISEAVKLWPDFVHVHAGLIATAEQSALLIGRSGSGKSTTTVALAQDGLDLFTDDVALIDRSTLRPYSVPRPIKLDRRSRAMLRRRGLAIPPRRRLNESIDRLVLPGLPAVEQPGPPLRSAIFFADARAATPCIRPINSAEAVMRLIQQSASERFDHSGPSDGAVALVNAVRCYELVAGDLESTVQAIHGHLLSIAVGSAGDSRQELIAAAM